MCLAAQWGLAQPSVPPRPIACPDKSTPVTFLEEVVKPSHDGGIWGKRKCNQASRGNFSLSASEVNTHVTFRVLMPHRESWWLQLPGTLPTVCMHLYAPKSGHMDLGRGGKLSCANAASHLYLEMVTSPGFCTRARMKGQSAPSYLCTSAWERRAACKIRQALSPHFISFSDIPKRKSSCQETAGNGLKQIRLLSTS